MVIFFRKEKDEKYIWTYHARQKMKYYRLTESRIKRTIRHPGRVEESIVEGAVACMQRAESKHYSEIWTMYTLASGRANSKFQFPNSKQKQKKIKVITAWRYPGKSPERNPIPENILHEIKSLLA